ncbi:hypothetical protein NLN80_10555 [Citrobacter portucalensis]|uniref:hypothetical protein n=1 Tax=Citrobacter portucalensis TaxID=1639133 RepID=UPI00226BA90D|nr:hypothetical protein [Citrobacter portucalensis]MCX9007056.1 hypothetical protein [Citrobacter portucalensis]
MKRVILCLLTALINFDSMASCEIQPENQVCLTIFTKNSIASSFPVLNVKPVWKWYRTENIGEYYWQTELGTCNNDKFIPNGARLLIVLGSLRLNENPPAEGSLQDLLDTAEKKAFFDDEIANIHVRSPIRGAFVQKRSSDPAQLLAIFDNPSMVKYFKTKNSTFARMTAHLPEKNESYECITEIQYGVLSSERK